MTLLSQIDWPRILHKRTTAILLGIAALFTAQALFIRYSDFDFNKLSPLKNDLLAFAGASGAIGFLSLLVCMGFFWLRCDDSSKANRTFWFVILVVGCMYGTQIAYYAIVYVPAVLRRIRNPDAELQADALPVPETGNTRIGPFSRRLMISWGMIALLIIVMCELTKIGQSLAATFAVIFILCSALVIFESIFHFIASLYRSGMRRPALSDRTNSSRPPSQD